MAGPKWPHDHTEKHRQAALKGWMVRRAKAGGVTRPKAETPTRATLTPVVTRGRTVGEHVDIASPLDPRILPSLYGNRTREHLEEYSPRALAEMANLVKRPGERAPGARAGKTQLVEYISARIKPMPVAKPTPARQKTKAAKTAKTKATTSDGMERLRQREAALRTELARLNASFEEDIRSESWNRRNLAFNSTIPKRYRVTTQLRSVQTRIRNLGG